MSNEPIFEQMRREQANRTNSYEELCKPFLSPLEGFQALGGVVSQPLPLAVLKTPEVTAEGIEKIKQSITERPVMHLSKPMEWSNTDPEIDAGTIEKSGPPDYPVDIMSTFREQVEKFTQLHPNAVIDSLEPKFEENGGITFEIVAKEPAYDAVLRALGNVLKHTRVDVKLPQGSEMVKIFEESVPEHLIAEEDMSQELMLEYLSRTIVDKFPGHVPISISWTEDFVSGGRKFIVYGYKVDEIIETQDASTLSENTEDEEDQRTLGELITTEERIKYMNDEISINDLRRKYFKDTKLTEEQKQNIYRKSGGIVDLRDDNGFPRRNGPSKAFAELKDETPKEDLAARQLAMYRGVTGLTLVPTENTAQPKERVGGTDRFPIYTTDEEVRQQEESTREALSGFIERYDQNTTQPRPMQIVDDIDGE